MSTIIRAARSNLGMNQRTFSRAVAASLASGCSVPLVSQWERGEVKPTYEKMFYLYLHTDNWVLRQMACEAMACLNPEVAIRDMHLLAYTDQPTIARDK